MWNQLPTTLVIADCPDVRLVPSGLKIETMSHLADMGQFRPGCGLL